MGSEPMWATLTAAWHPPRCRRSSSSTTSLSLPEVSSSTSTTSMPSPEVLLVGVRPGSTLQPGSTHLLTCSIPSMTSPSVFDQRQPSSTSTSINQLNFTWSVDSRLHWVDPSPLHTESHSASSWEYVPQTGDGVVRCSVAWREKKDQEKVEAKTIEVEVKVARRAAKEDKAMVRLQREGSREERRGRKRRRNGSILWIPFRKDRKEDQDIGTHNGMDKEEEEEHLEVRDIYMYM